MSKISETILTALGLADIGPSIPIPGERRREYRRPVKLAAVCETMEPYKRLDCTVIDITNSGAQLEFATLAGVPNSFRLYILQLNAVLECREAWRGENNLGVSFRPAGNDFN